MKELSVLAAMMASKDISTSELSKLAKCLLFTKANVPEIHKEKILRKVRTKN